MTTFNVEIDSTTVGVEVDSDTAPVDVNPTGTVIYAVSPGGERGPQGEPGAAFEGVAWFYGEGPPAPSPVGAKPGDLYLDSTTGTIYKLGD